MLVNILKKNLNIILININLFNSVNFMILTDSYLHLYLKNFKNIFFLDFLRFLKYSSFFNLNSLLDIKCDDIILLSKIYRFKITYIFLNYKKNIRYFITLFVKPYESILSIKELYSSASFLEREIWDEYGVKFKNLFEIKRILTDYGFKGHPLKKDYPLTGFYECIFSFESGRVKVKPISLLQEYRQFTYKL